MQHDMILDNGPGASVRPDINNALQALASTSKGSSRPATVYAGQLWLDDSATPWVLKFYDGADDISMGEFDATNNTFRPVLSTALNEVTVSMAAAATMAIGAAKGNTINVTGTGVNISAFDTVAAGARRTLVFAAANTLVQNAVSMILPGVADIAVKAGDSFNFTSLGSGNWKCTGYTLADGSAIVGGGGGETGEVRMCPTSNLPGAAGDWLECDGSEISRTTYAALFAVIGTEYGTGDGSTTFKIPDYRGRFLRGWDHAAGVDPDAAIRTDRGDGTGGDVIGSKQAEDYLAHQHNITVGTSSAAHSSVPYSGTTPADSVDWQTQISGGNETRPINTSIMFIIKT